MTNIEKALAFLIEGRTEKLPHHSIKITRLFTKVRAGGL